MVIKWVIALGIYISVLRTIVTDNIGIKSTMLASVYMQSHAAKKAKSRNHK